MPTSRPKLNFSSETWWVKTTKGFVELWCWMWKPKLIKWKHTCYMSHFYAPSPWIQLPLLLLHQICQQHFNSSCPNPTSQSQQPKPQPSLKYPYQPLLLLYWTSLGQGCQCLKWEEHTLKGNWTSSDPTLRASAPAIRDLPLPLMGSGGGGVGTATKLRRSPT